MYIQINAEYPSKKVEKQVNNLIFDLKNAILNKDSFSVSVLVTRLKNLGYTVEPVTLQ